MFENVLELKKDAKPECHAGYIKNNYLNTVQWNCRISKINLTSHEREKVQNLPWKAIWRHSSQQ